MGEKGEWHIFGPAAICWALDRKLPPVVDVYITEYRPDRQQIVELLSKNKEIQIRYVTRKNRPLISLDYVRLEPFGSKLRKVDPIGALVQKQIYLCEYWLELEESLRLRYSAELFHEFDWPEYLMKKMQSDLLYAIEAAKEDSSILSTILNIQHDLSVHLI